MDETHAYCEADRLPEPSPGPAAAHATVPDPLKLVLLPSGMSIELKKPENLVGRQSNAEVRLPLADVSRRHCRLVYNAGSWQVIDLGSLNGIFVNDRKVQQATLFHRDRLRIGSLVFEVRLRTGGLGLSAPPLRRAS